jgi:hypothetical protein
MFGAIYLFCFIFFSMQVILNIFLTVIGDALAIIKETHKYDWLEVILLIFFNIFRIGKMISLLKMMITNLGKVMTLRS